MPRNDSEARVFTRPAANEIRSAWYALFSDPLLSLGNLKAVAAAGLGAPDEDGGILLRSVYWRFYFGLLPPPTSLDLFPPALAARRQAYDDLRARFLVAPDGRWAADCSGGEGYASSSSSSEGPGWDPLSLDGDSPWKTWFEHLELRQTIRQDVDRTFPDIPYFTLERVRKSLVTMLFIFSVLNPDVGYRQGMHELCAVCFIVADRDSLDRNNLDPSPVASPLSPLQRGAPSPSMQAAMAATLDRTFAEHDAFGLFQELMRPVKSLYEWRTEEAPPSLRLGGAPQAPILERCNHIHNQLLRRIDPQLWERLESVQVETQIWAIRWLRLILTRELPFPMALRLWDGMLAEDPNLGLLDFVCVAMLLLIRNELLEADYTSILTHLLHYPAPSASYPFNPSLILSQANFLRHDISPTAGVTVVLQNQDLLGVKATDRNSINLDIESPTAWRPGGTPSPRPNSARDKARAGVSGLAAGLFEKAQKAGLDKAFLTTVSDFRNNLPDASSAYAFLPSFSPTPQRESLSSSPSNPFTAAGLPNRPAQLPTSSSNISITSMLDAERQMAEMRLALLTMGKAMSQWMDTIREDSSTSGEGAEKVGEAWAGLNRVRDSLLDAAGKDVDEMVKDWAWNDDLDSSRSQASSTAPTPIEETSDRVIVLKTPTRSGFEELPPEDNATVHQTPKGPGRANAPPPIPVIPMTTHVPSGPATARPDASLSKAQGSPGLSSAPPATQPQVFAPLQNQRPSTSVPRVPLPLHSPQPSSTTLPSAEALARAVSPTTASDNSASPKVSKRNDAGSQGSYASNSSSATNSSNNTANNGKASAALEGPAVIQPPPRGTSIRATSTTTGTNPSERTIGGPSHGSADPLAGLDVGSMATPRHGHERKRSAWRLSAPQSTLMSASKSPSSGSGSGSGGEPVGVDPLGVNG